MRVAGRLAYWGPAYHGYARQPDIETVEGDLIQALTSIRAIINPVDARLAVASRTDAKVSALSNVVSFDSSIPPAKLPGATIGKMHDAWLWACSRVPEGFDPRQARRRHYRYHFASHVSTGRLAEAASLFKGEHDFVSFIVGRTPRRLRIDRIEVRPDAPFVTADFEGERFARGLVRRIAGAMEAYARGEVTKSDIRDALQGGLARTRPAPPEGLFLVDVDCGLSWPPPARRVIEAFSVRGHVASLAHRFGSDMSANLDAHRRST